MKMCWLSRSYAILKSQNPSTKSQGVRCRVSGKRNIEAEIWTLKPPSVLKPDTWHLNPWSLGFALRLRSGPWACRTAVLILVTNILINSTVYSKISSNSSSFLISGTRWISFNNLWVSLSSFNGILALVFVFDSTFDVGRSMFDVHFFSVNLPQSPGIKMT